MQRVFSSDWSSFLTEKKSYVIIVIIISSGEHSYYHVISELAANRVI